MAALMSASALLSVVARADDAVHWATDLETAKRMAAQTNRLVLVHFWAPWCGPCMRLETTVFNQPGVARDLEARFVPVKLNADDWPATARNFGIERLPTDVIVTPTGRALYKLGCPSDPNQYMAQLSQAAASAQGIAIGSPPNQQPIIAAQAATVPLNPSAAPNVGLQNNVASARPTIVAAAPGTATPDVPIGNGSASPAARSAASDIAPPPNFAQNNYASYAPRNPIVEAALNRQIPSNANAGSLPGASTSAFGTGGNAAGGSNSRQGVNAQPGLSPNVQSLGLDGFCPVTLIERSRTAPDNPQCWMRGDPRWGAVHRGVTYLFNGPEEQKRFLANPDQYAPALGGNDAVMAFDRAKLVRGRREFGTFCENRIYLFASKETLDEFQKDPRRYVEEVRQAENPPHAAVR
ncbi:MAG TPA: thioredoxin domain-containing protein [Pirellulales bacterium]|nr:thioredoxin domain-containing protein [Pirellulales bacterium]